MRIWTIGKLVESLIGTTELPKWPPDLFAVAASILADTGSYVVATRLGVCCPDGWPEQAKLVSDAWRCGLTRSLEQRCDIAPPEEIRELWKSVIAIRDVGLLDISSAKYAKEIIDIMKFLDVVGKQEVKNRLLHSVEEGRISHAQLFSGQEGGIGLPLAIAYACYIHCESPLPDDSCGTCASCKKYAKLVHPDLHFSYPVIKLAEHKDRSPRSMDFIKQWRSALLSNPYMDLTYWYDALGVDNKQGFMSVEESADIIRKLSLKSFESKYKILIMWLPEKMRPDASNKLLKIIEEPPENTLFILVTEHREQLLPTILSRTQLVKIPRLSVQEVSDSIRVNFAKDAISARKIASLAYGNMNMATQLASEKAQDFRIENDFITWMRLCYNPFHEKEGRFAWNDLNTCIDQMAKGGREYLKLFITFCLDASRECLLVNHADASLAKFDDDVIPNFSKFTRFIHSSNIGEIAGLLDKAHYAVERNANPKILLLDLSFKMHRLLNKPRQ